jgi:phospholipid transport system substrate-binding protein
MLTFAVFMLATAQFRALAAESPVQPTAPGASTGSTTTRPADASASGMMQETITDLLAILSDKTMQRSQKMDAVSDLSREHLDFQTLGRLTLGGSWRDLTEAQRREFTRQFTDHLLGIYLPVLADYSGQEVSVKEDRPEQGGDHTVTTSVTDRKGPGGALRQVATVACRLRRTDSAWKVIDLSIEGISVAMVFRAQFQPVVISSGIDVLIDRLRQKNASGQQRERGTD